MIKCKDLVLCAALCINDLLLFPGNFLVIMIEILTMSPNEVTFKIYDIPKSLTNLITIYLFCFIDFLTVYLKLDANFNIIMTKKVPWYFFRVA